MAKTSISVPHITQTQVLVALLIIASFVIGLLFPKNGGTYLGAATGNTLPSVPQAGAPAGRQAPPPGQKVDVSTGSLPILGNKNAKVKVIEFGDFQCPFCGRWFTDVEPNIIKDYVNSGKVQFAFRNYAFLGQESTDAANAAECANEQGKFWDFHNYLYSHQSGENQGAFAKDKLKGFAQTLGLNTSQFNSCFDSGKYSKNVADDLSDGQKAGVNGTPATFVNGQLVSGAQPYSAFKTIIDAELAK